LFCECCGMRLRASPTNRESKEKVRAKKKLIGVESLPTNIQIFFMVYFTSAGALVPGNGIRGFFKRI
jgi:hypothetical protein